MALSVRLPIRLNCDNQTTLLTCSTDLKKDQNLGQEGCQDFVQHYLIQQHHNVASANESVNSNDIVNENMENKNKVKPKLKMKLESSHNSFDNILSLVYHYLTVK